MQLGGEDIVSCAPAVLVDVVPLLPEEGSVVRVGRLVVVTAVGGQLLKESARLRCGREVRRHYDGWRGATTHSEEKRGGEPDQDPRRAPSRCTARGGAVSPGSLGGRAAPSEEIHDSADLAEEPEHDADRQECKLDRELHEGFPSSMRVTLPTSSLPGASLPRTQAPNSWSAASIFGS